MKKDKFLHVPVDPDFKERVEEAAKKEGRSVANFTRYHLEIAVNAAIGPQEKK